MIRNVINHEIPVSAIYDTRDYVFFMYGIKKNSVMAFGRKRVPDFMCMCWLLFFFLLASFYLFIQGFVFIVRRVILAYQRDTL